MASSISSMPVPILAETWIDCEGIEPQVAVDLFHHPLDVGGGQVDLVDHRQDRQVVLHGQIQIGHGLGLDSLRGIDHEKRALAAHKRAAHLVRESTCPGVSIRLSS